MISQSYRYPLRVPHGFIAQLLRLGRELGLLASPPEIVMTRRHRMMFTMDEHRRHRRPKATSGDLVPPVAAVSQPTQFGPLCFAVATLGAEPFQMVPKDPEDAARDARIDHRVRLERAHLTLDLEHRERVRSAQLSDEDATRSVRARRRQIRFLTELRRSR